MKQWIQSKSVHKTHLDTTKVRLKPTVVLQKKKKKKSKTKIEILF